MKVYQLIPFFFCLFSFMFESNAQHFLSTNGKAIVNESQDTILLRGMGLGGWMVQEGYMLQTAAFANPQHAIRQKIVELIGESKTDEFYEAWLANHVRKADIDALKSWGFNSVRLPMHYNLFTLPIEEEAISGENTWLTKGFELTDSLISWCKQNEMYVVLDLHAAPGGQGQDEGISDYDPSKPSLWEDGRNREKTVALWQKLAERYADEQWVAGYDLLNETNWQLPGGVPLRKLYEDITEAIRSVDTKHIIFIEGNWFANDFTGLTPPWDDNMVYSPHKYWSTNDQASMQWVLDMREEFNVPLYLGESGENSNVWFRDAIRLFEDLEIGWAWWPMKKIESIAGPLSVVKTSDYQELLDYWNGEGSFPSPAFATNALMEITEGLKFENCVYQKDVIDAMFRQVYSDETVPYVDHEIPGLIYATDFDLGIVGQAYYDNEVANYQVSTGNFTSWNNGWIYRNDGVDIEPCMDNVNSNGFNVGWLDANEWMQYEVDIVESGLYDIHIRTASAAATGRCHFSNGAAQLTPSISISPSGDWQNWETTIVENVYLDTSDPKIRFYVDQAGFNLSSYEFIKRPEDANSIATSFVAARTIDEQSIQMNLNKLLELPLQSNASDFEIFVNGNSIAINEVAGDLTNPRIINFSFDDLLKFSDEITISYSGNDVSATDGTNLDPFNFEPVENTLQFVYEIPTKIEAEDYSFQSGVQLENSTDAGGGQNIGYLDPGDFVDFEVNISSGGTYDIAYRTAGEFGTGGLELQLIDELGSITVLDNPSFGSTGGWQDWITINRLVKMPAGRYTMRLLITQSPFNLNWIDFGLVSSTSESARSIQETLKLFPNPTSSSFNLDLALNKTQDVILNVYDPNGKRILSRPFSKVKTLIENISLNGLAEGLYFISIVKEDHSMLTRKIMKVN